MQIGDFVAVLSKDAEGILEQRYVGPSGLTIWKISGQLYSDDFVRMRIAIGEAAFKTYEDNPIPFIVRGVQRQGSKYVVLSDRGDEYPIDLISTIRSGYGQAIIRAPGESVEIVPIRDCQDITRQNKLSAANQILKTFAPDTVISWAPGVGWRCKWTTADGKQFTRRWQTSGHGSQYPIWHRHWPYGGTDCQALSQIMRWLQGRPVFGIDTWKYWRNNALGNDQTIELLERAGWPTKHVCVLCGKRIPWDRGVYWWDLGKTSGPCCFSCPCRNKKGQS